MSLLIVLLIWLSAKASGLGPKGGSNLPFLVCLRDHSNIL